jgi:membrane protease YdiL (CAAX protease family)
MSSSAVTTSGDTASKLVAPWWHTVLVLIPIAVSSVAAWYQHGLPNAQLPGMSSRLSSYITVLALEWFVVVLIWLALKRRGLLVSSLVAGRWQTVGAFFRDVGLALGFLVVVIRRIALLAHLLGADTSSYVTKSLLKNVLELLVWLGCAATAGFCEELIFRGYLTRQFSAWTGSRVWAIVLQGIVFGLAHGYYQKLMVVIVIQGWLLGLLAYWRKSLRPGMLAHGLQDGIGGVVGFFTTR